MHICSCGKISRFGQRKCTQCHSAYMRTWRKTHKLTGDARLKDIVRHIAGVYQRRGILIPKPCEVFGCTNKSEKHHDDYNKPLEVRWICRKHHLAFHKVARETLVKNGI